MQPQKEKPWMWSIEEIKSTAQQVSAGRDLNPVKWPNGARVAVLLTFDIDIETPGLAHGTGRISEGEYGARVGFKRIADLLNKHHISATFFAPAVSLMLHPELVDIAQKTGTHEIGNHGWIHENTTSISEDYEGELLIRSIEYLREVTGDGPRGYRSPSWNLRRNTLDLLQEFGFLYDSSLMADDRPYEILIDGSPSGIVELPVDWILDDFPLLYVPGKRYCSPRELLTVFIDEFDKAYTEGTTFILTMHPEITGHRSRIIVLEKLIEHMQSKGNVWFATCSQVAEYVKKILEKANEQIINKAK